MAKIVVSEKINDAGANILKNSEHEVVFIQNRDYDALRAELCDADALLVRIMDIDKGMMESAPKLKIISKHGVGLDNIDVSAAKELGIRVTCTATSNSQSVAEHAFSLLMSLTKNLQISTKAYKEIGFAAKAQAKEGREIFGKTIGIVGYGRIGSRIARIARYGFQMRTLIYDPYVTEVEEGMELVSDRDMLFREADYVTLHCPMNAETGKSVGKHEFSLMKPTALLINCARGPIVDEAALIEALRAGEIAGAGMDVSDPEPMEADNPLMSMDNVMVTPHLAGTTKEAATKTSSISAENVLACLSGGEMVGVIC